MPFQVESNFVRMLADQAFPPRHLKEILASYKLELDPNQSEIIGECANDPASRSFWFSIKIKIRRIER
jgi:hypothetical protein